MSSRPDSRALIRRAVTPRWIAISLFVLAAAAVCVALGRWQWERTQDIVQAEEAARAAPVAVDTVLPASGDFPNDQTGRQVLAAGTYLADQIVVPNRELDGRSGSWVVSGLRLADGTVLAVVRGWVPLDAPATPIGAVSIRGVLQPDEPFYADAPVQDGKALAVSSSSLSQAWGTTVRPGFVVLASQDPPDSAAPAVVRPQVQTADVPFPLRNFFYAWQWWVFALFAIAAAGRFLWLETREAKS